MGVQVELQLTRLSPNSVGRVRVIWPVGLLAGMMMVAVTVMSALFCLLEGSRIAELKAAV